MNERFNSPMHSHMVMDMEHEMPPIICADDEQVYVYLTFLNRLCDEKRLYEQKVTDILQKHYDVAKNGMNEMAKKECYSGYGAFKLEYGQVKMIARDLGIDLDE